MRRDADAFDTWFQSLLGAVSLSDGGAYSLWTRVSRFQSLLGAVSLSDLVQEAKGVDGTKFQSLLGAVSLSDLWKALTTHRAVSFQSLLGAVSLSDDTYSIESGVTLFVSIPLRSRQPFRHHHGPDVNAYTPCFNPS